MKHEWRKLEKDLYIPKQKPEFTTIPEYKFISIKGQGNPNSNEFSEKIGVLYSLAYAIRMMPKNGYTPKGYFEYTIYPLEGVWDLSEKGKELDDLDKDELLYTLMIRQPDFVDDEIIERALERIRKKKPDPRLHEIEFETINDGLVVQMLHVGSFDNEPESFRYMKEYVTDNKFERTSLQHREIYLSDFRKVESTKLKTVLRYCVQPKE